MSIEIDEVEIRAKSGVDANEEWRGPFDEWGAQQPRRYLVTPAPGGERGTRVIVQANQVTGFTVTKTA